MSPALNSLFRAQITSSLQSSFTDKQNIFREVGRVPAATRPPGFQSCWQPHCSRLQTDLGLTLSAVRMISERLRSSTTVQCLKRRRNHKSVMCTSAVKGTLTHPHMFGCFLQLSFHGEGLGEHHHLVTGWQWWACSETANDEKPSETFVVASCFPAVL